MTSRKKLVYVVIICVITIGSISAYLALTNLGTVDTTSLKKITMISTEPSTRYTTIGLVDLSLKGYLKTSDNIGISNENIQIDLKGMQIDDNQTTEEDLVIGNSTTDQNGCFYFNDWSNKALNNTLVKIPTSYNVINGMLNKTPQPMLRPANLHNMLLFATNFTGDDNFLSSSNTTKIQFSPAMMTIERPAINIDLDNSTSLVQDIYLKKGEIYDFDLLAFNGSSLLGSKSLKFDIKGLPCGVTATFENNMSNFTGQQNITTHLKISVDENAQAGEYYYFIMGNNWILREARLIIQ